MQPTHRQSPNLSTASPSLVQTHPRLAADVEFRAFEHGEGETQELFGDGHLLDVFASHRQEAFPNGLVCRRDAVHGLFRGPFLDFAARVVALSEQLEAGHSDRVKFVVPGR